MRVTCQSILRAFLRVLFFILLSLVSQPLQGQVTFNIGTKLPLWHVQAEGVHPIEEGYVFVAGSLIDTMYERWGYALGSLNSEGSMTCYREFISMNGVRRLFGSSILSVNDSMFIKVGTAWNPDGVFLVAFNKQCDTLFTRLYETAFGDSVQSHVVQGLRRCRDGGYIITTGFSGYEYPQLRREVGVYKLNKDFELVWSKVFGRGHRIQQGIDVVQTESGGFLIFGLDYYDNDPDYDSIRRPLYFIELDSLGGLVKEKFNGHEIRSASFEVVEADDGYVLCSSELFASHIGLISENSVFKIDKELNYVWETKVGTLKRASSASYRSIVASLDGKGIVTAGTAVDSIDGENYFYGVITKVSWEGDSIWTRYYVLEDDYPSWKHTNYIWRIRPASDGGYITIGEIVFMPGTPISPFHQQIWFLKTDEYGCIVPGCHKPSSVDGMNADEILQVSMYPNPFDDYLNVFVKQQYPKDGWIINVTDLLGRRMYAQEFNVGEMNLVLGTKKWVQGTYIISIMRNGQIVASEKAVKINE